MRFLEESKHHHLPRIKTVQNPYSLLNRLFCGSAEICVREDALAYSPMAFGIFSGKFLTEKNILTQELTYFLNLQDTIAPSAEATKVISGNCA
jgi:aryl-alcohol dehydrogenase-like predicted oxidoreductase